MDEQQELTGKVSASLIGPQPERISTEIKERFLKIEDLSGTVSDVLDELGVQGCIGSTALRPTMPERRIVGTAITLRNRPVERQAYLNTSTKTNRLGEIEGHNQARPGDVLVIQGLPGVSNGGGLSAAVGKRQGEIGAVIEGGCRDIAWTRKIDYPIWSTEVTPVTGKWRVQAAEVNGPVSIQGIVVNPGDLVIADETGVCFIPADLVETVLVRVEEVVAGEEERHQDIESGVPVPVIAKKPYGYLGTALAAED